MKKVNNSIIFAATFLFINFSIVNLTVAGDTIVVDQVGRKVAVTDKVKRVVSLSPEGTRVVIALGAADKLVGVGSYSQRAIFSQYSEVFPWGKELPNVGKLTGPNMELIVSLNPDVILGGWSYPPEATSLIQEKTGIPAVCVYTNKTIEGTFKEIETIGKIIGKEKEAKKLIAYLDKKIDKVKEVVSQIPESEKRKVYLSFWGEITKTPVLYEPVDIAGGINAASSVARGAGGWGKGRWGAKVSTEQILDWNPDVILVHRSGSKKAPKASVSIEKVISEPALKLTNAVKNGRVYYTPGMICGWDHPRLFTEILYMAKLFYPDRFKELDVAKEADKIFKRFYGVGGLWEKLSKRCGYYEWE